MTSGSGKGSRKIVPANSSGKTTVPKTSYRVGVLIAKPVKQSKAYERTTRVRHEDKQTGSYERFTHKEKVSTGELHVERESGRLGVKDEVTNRTTVKIGNKSGYTEYQTEERIRDVKFGGTGAITISDTKDYGVGAGCGYGNDYGNDYSDSDDYY